MTSSVIEFRERGLRSLETEVPNYTKGLPLPYTRYIHPKWAFSPTSPSLSQTIDNRPVLALLPFEPSSILECEANEILSKFIVPSNCSNHSAMRTLGGTAVPGSVLESNELSQFSIDDGRKCLLASQWSFFSFPERKGLASQN